MADFPKLLTTFIVITLFAFLLVGFATQLGNDYGEDQAVTELEERIGSETISSSLENIEEVSTGWKSTFEDWGSGSVWENLLDVIGFFAVGIFNLAKGMANFVWTPFAMFSQILVNVIGIPVVVATILQVLLLLSIIFGIWRLIKTGQ